MYNFHTVDIAYCKFIKCDYILGIVVFDFKQIGNLTV